MTVESTRVKRNNVDPATLWRFLTNPVVPGEQPRGVVVTQYGPLRWVASGDWLRFEFGSQDGAADFVVHRCPYIGSTGLKFNKENEEWAIQHSSPRRQDLGFPVDQPSHEARRAMDVLCRRLAAQVMHQPAVNAAAQLYRFTLERDAARAVMLESMKMAEEQKRKMDQAQVMVAKLEDELAGLGINKC